MESGDTHRGRKMKALLTLAPTNLRSGFMLGLLAASGLSSGDIPSLLVFLDLQAADVKGQMKRRIVKHEAVGREGDIIQDLGRRSTPITVSGKWIYENPAQDSMNRLISSLLAKWTNFGWNWFRLETIKALAATGIPLMFASDEFIGPVLIEQFDYGRWTPGFPNVINWKLEFIELNPALSLIGSLLFGGFNYISNQLTSGDTVVRRGF